MNTYLDSFLRNKTNNTKVAYLFDINQMLEYVNKPIEGITYGDIVNYKEHFETKYAYNSMALKLRAICSYFEYLYTEKEVISINPTLNRNNKKIKATIIKTEVIDNKIVKGNEPKQSKYYTIEEAKNLIKFAKNSRDKAIICVYLLTGVRANELINLTLNDYANKTAFIITKGGKTREIIFNILCQKYIDEYLKTRKETEFNNLFISNSGKPMRADCITNTLKVISKRAGLGVDIHSHSLRHTCITNVMKKTDIETAKAFIGHSSLNTTMRYIHTTNKDVKNVAMNIGF